MKRSTLASRTHGAIVDIGEILEIDLSRGAMPRSPTTLILNLHRLEAIRDALQEQARESDELPEVYGELEAAHEEIRYLRKNARADLLAEISEIKGVGPGTMDLIADGLDKSRSTDDE